MGFNQLILLYTAFKKAVRSLRLNAPYGTDTLIICGDKKFLESFSDNLPYDANEIPYHIHYDDISFPQYLNADSPEVIIEAIE